MGNAPASWRIGLRTPATWTLAAAFAVASAGSGLAWPGADLRGTPDRPKAEPAALALPELGWPEDDPFLASTSAPARVAAAIEPPAPAVPARRTIPLGKGMWLHTFNSAHGGDQAKIVNHALSHGITHLYVRTGSSRMGFYAQHDLDRILPAAHAAGIKVIGWDFPYLHDPLADAERGHQAITYTTPDGHQIDGFSADIETQSEGTNLTSAGASAYGTRLRELAGAEYPLIATVPRPNPKRWYPYAEVVEHFDAIAPMVYWINRNPITDVIGAMDALRHFNKPILPVGQAYDPGIDGERRWGPPSRQQITDFLQTSAQHGAASVSFWAWNTANPDQWAAISDWKSFDVDKLGAPPTDPEAVAALQRVLNALRFTTPVDGVFGPDTQRAVAEYQARHGLPATGRVDGPTVATLVKPFTA